MYHIQMLQCSCYYIWNCRIRLRKSGSQLEKIVTLELESTDLEYCKRTLEVVASRHRGASGMHTSCTSMVGDGRRVEMPRES
jgi:hypothetical protein